ncbi:MAG: ABC transporter substrate-binding protein [Promethearchaeota archaeon]
MKNITKLGMMLFLLTFPFLLSVLPNGTALSFVYSNSGPYVDKVVYMEISSGDERVLAIQNNDIDMISGAVDLPSLDTLEMDPNIAIDRTVNNGFGQLTINCDKYPLNMTAFRRALAFAINKTKIAEWTWIGEAQPHDTHVPAPNPWSYESLLSETYYAAQLATGNQLLDAAGFVDIDADGFREAPDGSNFDVLVEVPTSSLVGIECGAAAGDALDALNIDNTVQLTDFNVYMSRVLTHGDFDIVFYAISYRDFEPAFLETEYGSAYYLVDYYNTANFQNATYDSWIPQFLYATSYVDVLEAVHEMQKILWFQQPRIILYDNYNLEAYRTDVYEGHVSSAVEGIANTWTNLKVHKKTGDPYGGTFRIGLGSTPESFNHMVATSSYAHQVLGNMENTLMRPGPDGSLTPWLAESYLIETHVDNPAVPLGHTRLTFDIVSNATWSDGTALTAQDVAFTLNYYKDSLVYGNPTNPKLSEMSMAYAPTTYQLVVEMDTESFWHLNTVACNAILPQHILSPFGAEGWNTWNPIFSADPFITSGPFEVTEFVSGDFVELTYSPNFFFSERTSCIGVELEYPEGSTGNTINWDFTQASPLNYEVYKDGSLIATEVWDGSPIEYNVDGLSLGTYNYTIVAYYGADKSSSSTIWVTVYDGTPPIISAASDVTLYEGRPETIIEWSVSDLHPVAYVVMVNDTLATFGLWNSSSESIVFSMSEYDVGTYSVMLIVSDIGMNMANDSLLVTIVPYVPPTTTTTTTDSTATDPMLLSVIGIGAALIVFIVVIVVLKKRP